MNILHVVPYFNPRRGGDVNVCYMVAKELAHRGNSVTIITTDYEFDKEYAGSIKGVTVLPFHCSVNLSLFLFSPSMLGWLRNNIDKFDVIHVHDFRTFQNILIRYLAKKYNVPYILQAHGDIPYAGIKNTRKKAFDKLFGYSILNDASALIALTTTEFEEYMDMGASKEKIIIVPNGVDLSDFKSLPDRGGFRRKHGLNEESKIILYIGRIHKTKGLDMLLSAFSYLLNKASNGDNVLLLIIGPDHGDLSFLKKLALNLGVQDKVMFTGFLNNGEKIKALIDADVFVTPAFLGFPVSFIEACACSKPLVITANGDKLEWINNNVGCVVDYGVPELAMAMSIILNDEKLSKRFGNNGRRLVEEEFNWIKIADKVEGFYRSLSQNDVKLKLKN